MNFFFTIEHIALSRLLEEVMGEKYLAHIVKVSDDTFAQSEIIPYSG